MPSEEQHGKLDYLRWALAQFGRADHACPGCGRATARSVKRKFVVTALYECGTCHLRFRVPKDSVTKAEELYRTEQYRQSFTTTMPGTEELERLLRTKFKGTEKDFAEYIAVLRETGLCEGARVLDFGCSWGYGSWQMKEAGFKVFSYEIGQDRARYARERLGCAMVENLRTLDGTIDCFFSAHVIEHLPDPNLIFNEATRLLREEGWFICFCPNGNPDRERHDANYHRTWGKVHPLFITPGFVRWACSKHGLTVHRISAEDNLLGPELLIIASKSKGF